MNRWAWRAFVGLFVAVMAVPVVAQGPAVDRTLLTRFHSPSFGEPGAKVEIVEFFDPACEACRAVYPIVKQILREHGGRVRLTLRYVAFHKGADEVVKLLEAARRQGKYEVALETLLGAQSRWTERHVANRNLALRAVEGLGLDMARLKADMASPDLARLVKQDMDDARALQVTRTPQFFVNGKPLTELSIEGLQALVAQEVRLAYGSAAKP